MKSVLISIRPEWCEKIANGDKTIEVRKTKPNIETPFKCYIYCTIGDNPLIPPHLNDSHYQIHKQNGRKKWKGKYDEGTDYKGFLNGKVIGEFVCSKVESVGILNNLQVDIDVVIKSCLEVEDILEYSNGKKVYAWYISELKIYDRPKKLSEFYRQEEKYCYDFTRCEDCEHWGYTRVNADEFDMDCDIGGFLGYEKIQITSPPQSWCYVEELK